jgi:serine phosphatase RsbU (regulator of sigma subunit)
MEKDADNELVTTRELTHRLRAIYLPSSPPLVPGYELAWCYAPVSETEGVSGDCLDAIFDGNMLHFIVGDVSGKGLHAATNSVLVCNMWRGITSGEEHPTFILTALRRAVERFFEEDQFVTMVCGCLHVQSGLFSIANAGHPPGILKHSGQCRFLKQGDVALGISPEQILTTRQSQPRELKKVEFEAAEYRLQRGDQLLLFTDGIIEAANESELYGEQRLLEEFERCEENTAQAVIETLYAGIKAWAIGGLRDDIALFLLKRG